MIKATHIYKSFDDVEVLKDISFVFEEGKTNLISFSMVESLGK